MITRWWECVPLAWRAAAESTCCRGGVGAVAVSRYGTVLDTAYNGGCCTACKTRDRNVVCACLHAEAKLLLHTSMRFRCSRTLEIIVTKTPCDHCWAMMSYMRVSNVIYWADNHRWTHNSPDEIIAARRGHTDRG